MNKRLIYLSLIAIILLGLFLRMYGISNQSYWLDESYSISDAHKTSLTGVLASLKTDQPVPPLYFILLHFWIQLFGLSELATRSLSSIFSVFSIIFVYLTVKKISKEEVALLTALIFAISLPEIVFAQETRCYAFFTFLAVLSTYYFIKSISENKKYNYYLYTLLITLAVYTNYFAVVLIALQLSYFLFAKYNIHKLYSILLCQVIAGLLFMFWFPTLLRQIIPLQRYHQEMFLAYNFPPLIAELGLFVFFIPIILFFTLIAFFYFNNKLSFNMIIRINDKYPYILPLIFILCLILSTPLLIKSKMGVRYYVFLSSAIYFIVAKNALLLNKNLKKVILILLFLAFAFSLMVGYNSITKTQWREAVNFIESEKNIGEGAIVLETSENLFLTNIYYKGNLPIIPIYSNMTHSASELKEKIDDKDYVWLVLSRNWARKELYKNILDSLYGEPDTQKEFFDIKIYLYKMK